MTGTQATRRAVNEAFSTTLTPEKADQDKAVNVLRNHLRQGLESENKAQTQAALRELLQLLIAMGYFDLLAGSGVDEKAHFNQVLRHALVDGPDFEKWLREGKNAADLYESLLAEISKASNFKFENGKLGGNLPCFVLMWWAFGPGSLRNPPRPEWLGIDPTKIIENSTGENVHYWIFKDKNAKNTDEESSWASYDSYVDHLYERLDELAESIDVLFVDLIMLSDLARRKLIVELDDVDGLAKSDGEGAPNLTEEHDLLAKLSNERPSLKPELGSISRLGKVVTVNYHVPAMAKGLIDAMKGCAEDLAKGGETPPCFVAAIDALKALRDDLSPKAKKLLTFQCGSPRRADFEDLQAGDFAKSLDVPAVWKAEVFGEATRPYLSHQDFADRWTKAHGTGSVGRSILAEDTFLMKLGAHHPMAPIQMAPGAHATYTAFAFFANCSTGVSSLISRADVDLKGEGKVPLRLKDPYGGPVENLLKDDMVQRRAGEYLILPKQHDLEERAEQFFGFLWHFVPALSLGLDQVSSALVREQLYADRWFDPCLPVETALFQSSAWLSKTWRSTTSASANDAGTKKLSCLGGYAFAISSRSAHRKRSIDVMRNGLVKPFLSSCVAQGADFYDMCVARAGRVDVLADAAIRPAVPFWPLLDNVISETVRLYFAALVVLRCLRCDVIQIVGTGVPNQTAMKGWWEPILRDLKATKVELSQDLYAMNQDELFLELRRLISASAVENIFVELNQRVSGEPKLGDQTTNAIQSLIVDSDYIAGIVHSSDSIATLSRQFAETLRFKISQIARSHSWKIVQIE